MSHEIFLIDGSHYRPAAASPFSPRQWLSLDYKPSPPPIPIRMAAPMKRRTIATLAFLGLAAVVAVSLSLRAFRAYQYPYGISHCCDKQIGMSLLQYAEQNGGQFPTGGACAEASLSSLYPVWLDANTLRGKTVPLEVVEQQLATGHGLTPNTCGWHYEDGLHLVKPFSSRIAIVWDKVGLDHNGGRLPRGGHSVVFMDGHTAVICEADWNHFLQEQQKAWNAIRQGQPLTAAHPRHANQGHTPLAIYGAPRCGSWTTRARAMASRMLMGRMGKASSAERSRTTVGFFRPSIRCRPTIKLAGVTRASHKLDR